MTSFAAKPATRVDHLLTEYLASPLGIDDPNPGFSWRIESDRRGVRQTAYQIQVASSEKLLSAGKPDMWNSGMVTSSESVSIPYAGKKLASRTVYHWRVRVWDETDSPTAFSEPAAFETALLDPDDWAAGWIGVREFEGGNGYHSELANSADAVKWVQVDLREPRRFASVALYPARPYNWKHDVPGFGFPIRYRIECSDEPEFKSPRVIADRTDADQAPMAVIPVTVPVGDQTARYLRVVATKLHQPQGRRPLLALAELEVLDAQGRNIALDAPVTALDSIEDSGWSKMKLTDGGRVSREPGGAAPMLRKEFTLDKPVARARAYVTGLGYYELRLNGKRVGDRVLDPPYTGFDKRVYYSVYDITKLLNRGANCVGAMIGQGWWRRGPRLLVQIEVTHTDGSSTRFTTDGTWRWAPSPITMNSIYHGESYDARLEQPGWDRPGFDDSQWKPVDLFDLPGVVLSVQTIQPIKVVQTLRPKEAREPKPGVWVFDLGQNFSGWCRLNVSGKAGETVKLRFAENLYPDGTVNQENLRSARATDTYVLRGSPSGVILNAVKNPEILRSAQNDKGGAGTEVYEPRFTYHGFRYVQLEGFPGTPTLDSVRGCVVHTALEPRGTFSCSNKLLNRVQDACAWGERTNFHAVPTDCPQRDERQGWMGDAHVSAYAMLYNFDMPPAYCKFLRDMKDAQGEDGRVPDTVPHVWGSNPGDPMWAAAYPMILWQTYLHTGDKSLLELHYGGIRRYVEMLRREAGESYIITRNNYGDWIAVEPTPTDLISTGAFMLVTDVLIRIAGELGRSDDVGTYRDLRGKIAAAFNAKFFDAKTSNYGNSSQFSNALPLYFDIVPKEHRQAVFANLVRNIESRQGHLSTGFVGTPYLMRVLVQNGRADLAYTIATREDYPGWGYMIAKGATTIWELWKYETGPGMNSHNHPALGFVSGWFYETLAGLAPDPEYPGWEHFTVKPHAAGDLKWAKGRVETVRGVVESSWKLTRDGIAVSVTVPPNATATVFVPTLGKSVFGITESGKPIWRDGRFMEREGITSGKDAGEWMCFSVGSGTYVFSLSSAPSKR